MCAELEKRDAGSDEAEIRRLILGWARAVREEDFAGIRAHHSDDMLMFDVPPPFKSCGLDAYMATWGLFYPMQARPIRFEFEQIEIKAGPDVAFSTAIGHCAYIERGEVTELQFRLTMGLEKRDGEWVIVHEHHSVPATD